MARNDVYLNINALSPADAVVTGQQDMTAATVPELVLGDTPTFNFYFTDNTNVWPSWAGNAAYTVTWALSDAVSGDFSPAATTGNATPITGGWSVVLPLNAYDLVGLLNTKRVSQPYPVTNLWQQIRVADPSGNEITRAMFWTPIRYRAISDTQNTESASPTGGREVTVDNVNALTTPTAAQFYAANPVPTSALGSAANGELLIGNGTGFTKATLTAGSGVSITNGSGSITITATDGDITLDDGTAAAPSLKFTADTDTGIYRPSDNVVGISAGGVSRATFGATSAINGTTIPGSKTLVVTTDKLSALAATTSAELAGVISDETGSGSLVFATSPTLTTPILGTPQSGTLSSCTGLPISTGVSGLGTNVATFLATPSSANLASAVTDETGTGALVFANTPTLTTPNIGAATGTSVNLSGAGTFGGNLTLSGTTSTITLGSTNTANVAVNSSGALTVTSANGQTLVSQTTSGAHYVEIKRASQSTGQVGLSLNGGTSGNTWLMYQPASSNTLTWFGNSANRMSLDTSGNLTLDTGNLTVNGTGTSSFAGPLKLTYGTNLTGTDIGLFATSGGGLYINAPTTKNIRFGFNLGDRLTLDETTATFATNLTVSGTSALSGAVKLGSGSAVALGAQAVVVDAGSEMRLQLNSTDRPGIYFTAAGSNLATMRVNSTAFELLTTSGTPISISQSTLATTFGGNLTVSGGTITGGTSGLSLASGGTNQSITLTPSGTGATVISKAETNTNAITTALNYIKIQNTSSGGTYIGALEFYTWDNRRAAGIFANRNNVDGTSGVLSFAYSTSGNSFAEGFRLNYTGNLLIGTTTDGGQKLQVAGTGLFSTTEPTITLSSTAVGSIAYQLISGGGSGHTLGAFKIYDSSTGYVVLNHDKPTSGGTRLSFDGAGNATFAGNIKTAAPSGGTAATWRLGTVASVSPTSPNRTIEVEIGGTTYYIHAKTTNN